jgi:hypothetical protein
VWTEIAAAKAANRNEQVKELARRLLRTEKDDLRRAKLFSLCGEIRHELESLVAAAQTEKLAARIEVRNSEYFTGLRQLPAYRDLLRSMKLN